MSKNQPWAIETQGLSKRYENDIQAVKRLDLRIAGGSIYALLGPNGAGKTTTISMLTTLIEPTAGSACVSGYDILQEPDKVRQHIGVTFQDIVLDPDLSGREILEVHGKLYRQSKADRQQRIAELVRLVELDDAIDRKVKSYSGGMKRRLELARGLMTRPDILFLDEPTQGLDPQNRVAIWDYLRKLQSERRLTVLLTTHYMEEAEALAGRVGIIDHGELVIEGSPEELVNEMGADVIHLSGQGNQSAFLDDVKALDYVQRLHTSNGALQIGLDHGNRRLAELVSLANKNQYLIQDIRIARPSLGDVFLKYTGRRLRDE